MGEGRGRNGEIVKKVKCPMTFDQRPVPRSPISLIED